LFGSGFPSSLLCNLGNFAIVEALVLNEFQVICYFEKLSNAAGPFQIMVTPKERNFNVSAGVVSVMPSPESFAILPLYTELGRILVQSLSLENILRTHRI
jgi:hypothetical protein